MRVLIYGFGPYGQFEDNITQRVVGKLPRSRNLKKIVFPVRFDGKQFTDAVKKFGPDMVLGLGQCSKGKRLRIERRAINRMRNDKKERTRPIVHGGRKWLPTTLELGKLSLAKQAKISRDAGDYVCNFSMYLILDYLKHHDPATRFGFIHIPHRYKVSEVVRLLSRFLGELRSRSRVAPD
jgi:pyroglutamyl-peptidase